MTNLYYNNEANTLTVNEVALATDVEGKFAEVVSGFDLLPAPDSLARGSVSFVTDTGAANAYLAAMTPAITGYADGMEVAIRIVNANTGASTINVDSVAAKAIKRVSGDALEAGDLGAGALAELRFDDDNDYFVLLSLSPKFLTDAETAQLAAEAAQAAAGTSETNAGTSETNAASSASSASTSASTASTAKTNAETAETNAETAETNAETAETNAETAQAAAEAAQVAAEAAYDSFDDRYLGAKASDPSTDNDGGALTSGVMYYNTSSGLMKVYSGSAWVNAYVGDATLNTATDVSGNGWVLDQDNMSGNDATKVPTQQSVKAYVDGHLLDEDNMATDSATMPPSQQSTKAYADAITTALTAITPGATDKTSTATLTAAEVNGSKTITNDGAGAEIVLTWPALVDGQEATFYVNDAQYLQIKAPAATKIRIGTVQSADAGYVRSNTVGNWITIKAMPDELVVFAYGGAWTYDE